MNVIETGIEGLLILEPRVFPDDRGYFFESFNQKVMADVVGFTNPFVQDNQARSTRNVLRGLHLQTGEHAQTKLLRVLEGTIWDAVVDLRRDSKTYGRWFGVELSAENKRQFLVPKGFAHGYSVLSETAEVFYKCDNFYNKAAESGVLYSDPELGIDWKIPLSEAIVSDKDRILPTLKETGYKY